MICLLIRRIEAMFYKLQHCPRSVGQENISAFQWAHTLMVTLRNRFWASVFYDSFGLQSQKMDTDLTFQMKMQNSRFLQ